MEVILAIIALLLVATGMVNGWKFWKEMRARRLISRFPNFKPVRVWVSEHNGVAIAIDPQSQQVGVVDHRGRGSIIRFQDIAAVEIVRNGVSLIKTDRGSQILGGAVGAAILGPVGFLIGAVTGSKRKTEQIRKISLKIHIVDIIDPVREILFYEGRPINQDSKIYRSTALRLEELHDRLRAVIHINLRNHAIQALPTEIDGSLRSAGRTLQ